MKISTVYHACIIASRNQRSLHESIGKRMKRATSKMFNIRNNLVSAQETPNKVSQNRITYHLANSMIWSRIPQKWRITGQHEILGWDLPVAPRFSIKFMQPWLIPGDPCLNLASGQRMNETGEVPLFIRRRLRNSALIEWVEPHHLYFCSLLSMTWFRLSAFCLSHTSV